MRVQKRNGEFEQVDFNKISMRIKYLVEGIEPNGLNIGPKLCIDYTSIARDGISQIIDGITTNQLDEFISELCAYKVGIHQDYGIFASRLLISNHHKNTSKYANFSDMVAALYNNTDDDNVHTPLVSQDFYNCAQTYKHIIDPAVNANHVRDYHTLDYFGFKTVQKAYLIKIKSSKIGEFIQERFQHLLMRVALSMYSNDITEAMKAYEMMSLGYFTHATPTLFNSGTNMPQLSSCYLAGMFDSIDGMYEGIRRLSHISKWAGGIGLNLSKIRASGSLIRGTNGQSSGLVPLIKVLNEFARHVNQGGKRKGSVAVYIEPWHGDLIEFLDMKKNQGNEELRARDMFYALWIPDLFMKRLKLALTQKRMTGTSTVKWSLMCPDQCQGLNSTFGSKFEQLYTTYEKQGKYIRQLDITTVWQAIIDAQKETGTPYILFKDHINHKSGQANIGQIDISNLCSEIVQYSSHDEYAVCNLASINLKQMVKPKSATNPYPDYDFKLLAEVAGQVNKNLNQVIDVGMCPVKEARKSNMRHRAVGAGVQALADTFFLMDMPFESPQAQQLNKDIFEAMYYGSLRMSCDLAKLRYQQLVKVPVQLRQQLKQHSAFLDMYKNYFEDFKNKQYEHLNIAEQTTYDNYVSDMKVRQQQVNEIMTTYQLSGPVAEFQYLNMSDDIETEKYLGAYSTFYGSPAHQGKLQYDMWNVVPTDRFDWAQLKADIQQYGLRNSLVMAVMPTATSAQIFGSIECIEALTSNIYTRSVNSGTFMVINKYLQSQLTEMGLWTVELKDKILLNKGTITNIAEIPKHLRDLYKTVWEMSKKTLIQMTADRSPFIDQSQSFNLFIADPTDAVLTSCHMHSWELGLKTGMYYLRRQTLVDANQFSIDISKVKPTQSQSQSQSQSNKTTNTYEDPCAGGACSA